MAYSQHSAKMTLGINDIHQNGTQQTSGEYYYAECRDYQNVMLRVIILNVIMPNVVASLSCAQILDKCRNNVYKGQTL
jgi:hypothetical protein